VRGVRVRPVTKLATRLKQQALALGFDVVGICAAGPGAHAEFYGRWIEAGYAGEMHYLARRTDERSDPRSLLPGCRSIVVAGLNSYWPDEAVPPPGHGLIARFGRRDDYHQVMRQRLLALLDWLAAEAGRSPDTLGRVAVDSEPLLERELAVSAGLGWIGKNCSLISPRFGSWLLLGELLLEIELSPDEPWARPHCGTCTRCLDACPSRALVEPRLLDSRRCLAYLTITGSDPLFLPRAALTTPSLLELMALDDDEFRRRFRGSPILRPKRRGLLRNVAVALGNWGNAAARPPLCAALDDPEPLVREHARWALGKIGRDSAA